MPTMKALYLLSLMAGATVGCVRESQPSRTLVVSVTGPRASEATVVLTAPNGLVQTNTGNAASAQDAAAGLWQITATAPGQTDVTRSITVGDGVTVASLELVTAGELVALGNERQRFGPTLIPKDGQPAPPASDKLAGTFIHRITPGLYHVKGDDLTVGVVAGQRTEVVRQAGVDNIILVGGRRIPLDDAIEVVRFNEPNSLGYEEARAMVLEKTGSPLFGQRGPRGARVDPHDINALRNEVDLVLVDATRTLSVRSFHRQMLARGLSTHFTIDFDGTIFQSLDVGHRAFFAGAFNSRAIGVHLDNKLVDLVKSPEAPATAEGADRRQERAKHPRPKSQPTKINNLTVAAHGYTEAQYRSLASLVRTLASVFPLVGKPAPKFRDKVILDHTADGRHLVGTIAVSRCSEQSWSPGPGFDWARFQADVARGHGFGVHQAAKFSRRGR